MELRLERKHRRGKATLGFLHIDDVFQCFTLEDEVRERPGEPVEAWKVKGETAIPAGRYRVTITMSARFKRELPLLHAVPGFSGVRIHAGNTVADTEGCILVGTQATDQAVLESRKAFVELMAKIEGALDAGDECWIEIRNP